MSRRALIAQAALIFVIAGIFLIYSGNQRSRGVYHTDCAHIANATCDTASGPGVIQPRDAKRLAAGAVTLGVAVVLFVVAVRFEDKTSTSGSSARMAGA